MVISGYGDTVVFSFFPLYLFQWTGMNYIKTHLEQEPVQSNQSEQQEKEEEDYFDIMKDNVQETSKQLDVYLASTATTMVVLKSVPAVYRLSLKVNTPLPASAACERLFSSAGQIFTPKRGRLGSENFENQLLLKLNKKYW